MASVEGTGREGGTTGKSGLKLNRNLLLGFTLTGVFSFANNIYSTNVFPVFLLKVADGNTLLFGLAEGLQGLAQLVTAFPIGWLADKYKRKYLLWAGGLLWIIFIGLLAYATDIATQDSMRSFIILCVALSIGGVTNGIVGGPLMALLDDSTPAGYRSDMELYYGVIWNIASIAGPIVSLISFAEGENEWTMEQMKLIIYIGCAATVPCIILCIFFDDDLALGKESEAISRIEGEAAEVLGGRQGDGKKVLGFITTEMIPWFLFGLNLFFSLGAGMSVKFFPIFFADECGLSPVTLQILYIILPSVVVAFTLIATKLSKTWGRMQVIVCFNFLGIGHTLAMALMRSQYHNAEVMVTVYLLRCGFQWSTGGLAYSIIADYVPKEYRGRWNTLESISSFGWSGSAVLGGHLVKLSGYSTTFLITAVIQLLGVVLFALPITPLVALEKDIQKAVEALKDNEGELEEPLLGGNEARSAPRAVVPASSSIRGLPGMNPTFEETTGENGAGASSLSRSLSHLEHVARIGSLG
ncbi:MFS general substrate transporter [Chloropicon primus]|uniref:MFS general substrate transporter n=2 Tax=Chloropicon primus TaxID=1764295 RepID=A0A5B8MJ74_9CHLO|nr:MFS general substrate transporter [Chloropicon primus]UPQ99668.1 MFS general substrate transporter [Chloropicon primus]|eukprot:QDZ20459.1 MFS general substrate transporter [Chloropicon primus]